MSSTNTHNKQFYSKLKTIKMSNNPLISREHLELVRKYFSDCSIKKVSDVMMMWMMLLLKGLRLGSVRLSFQLELSPKSHLGSLCLSLEPSTSFYATHYVNTKIWHNKSKVCLFYDFFLFC